MLVFIPGIMGSRLKNEESSDIVWDPAPGKGWYDSSQMASVKARREKELTQLQSVDDGGVFNLLKHAYNIASDAVDYAVVYVAEIPRKSWRNVSGVVSSMFHYTFLSAKERKAELANDDKEDAFYRKKNFLSVDEGTDKYFCQKTSVPKSQVEEKRTRGWGTVLWGSYGEYLKSLQNNEQLFQNGCTGASFPVYAIGYNWMESNQASGEHIKTKIDEFKETLAKENPDGILKSDIEVILITHSMGGFVARSAVKLSGIESEIAYVIHGAMPTTGCPKTYQQLRTGDQSMAKLVLGINAAEMTAVVGFCQGALELLPNKDYTMADKTTQWLYYNNGEGENKPLPVACGKNIYDFYCQFNRWYSMIQPALLAPEVMADPSKTNQFDEYKKAYIKRIDECENYHQAFKVAGDYHNTTTAIFSTNTDNKALDACVWHGGNKLDANKVESWQVTDHENKSWFGDGTVELVVSKADKKISDSGGRVNSDSYTLGEPQIPGDGTVHMGLGENMPIIVNKEPIDATEDHQNFYNCPKVRTQVNGFIQACIEDLNKKRD
ncbi:lipase family alpha/beta hydrolase [Psychromonas sp. CNPT3]|uniref:lipase family alpha/beta hydrolase n=1 Tax=Psychromonas sp. CNPT3 TaxID=314282 RepID=UPI001E4CE0CA|nr:GPI inositol-deacylase [Psychromonas sp. CNPT3]